ncbi:aspartate-alanine antiporter [Agrobacterium pusense]|uniref:aspartate-alanine antiporter n=1 Tax=Agrobacterium pusense TaxID=648995 RepID=UPI0010BF5D3D|nr:aspartate-alanine antiporter [Agrobacterium pusense]MDH0117289.1 aspartate-alanine antiporter [Agrobacterium pusense]QCL86503.1 aspartate-alanine antiporter [Agrobacterium pusense]
MSFVAEIFRQSPEIALFLSLAFGYWIGKVQFGRFQLGGVAGSLLVAVVISQVGVQIDNGIKSVLFALFIYAVGFESGPQFFRSLGKQSIREIVLAAVLAISGLATVVVLAKLTGLDNGIAAGIAAGGLTQSAIIGTASSAIEKLGLAADETQRLQANVAIGYAVTYIFGSFGAIIVCVNILPWFMKRGIRDDAVKAEAEMLKGARVYGVGEAPALPDLVGRIFRVEGAAGKSIAELEALSTKGPITIERVKRGSALVGVEPELRLQNGDLVLIVGRRAGVVGLENLIGREVAAAEGLELVVTTRDIVVKDRDFADQTVARILERSKDLRHGIYVIQVTRAGVKLELTNDTVIRAGDIVTVHGVQEDLQRLSNRVGSVITPSDKTDFVYHGFGVAIGLLVGLLVLRIGSVPLTLGAGGGALLAGLVFGWYRSRNMTLGNMPTPASTLLRDLGLAGFVAVVGLQSGQQAVHTVAESGLSIFAIGVVVTVLPLLITMLVGRYLLKYDNVAVFAGALSGSRSANPAFGEILDKAGNSIPTTPFAITYALANVFLTLLGPLVVALV